MAMNKKEREALEDLKVRLALRHTDVDVPPDLDGSDRDRMAVGWTYRAYLTSCGRCYAVEKAWSSEWRHGRGWVVDEHTYSRGPIDLYSSKEKALRAARRELEMMFARELRKLDQELEECNGQNDNT